MDKDVWPAKNLKGAKKEMRSKEEFEKIANEVHGNFYDYSKAIYKGAGIKIEIICPVHGSFWQTPRDHLQKHGCKKCHFDKSKTWTKEEDDFLAENYKRITPFEIASQVKKTLVAVRRRADFLGLGQKQRKAHPHIPAYFWTNILSRAKEHGFEINISMDDIWDIYTKQDGKCALTGWDIYFGADSTKTTASLDRIDSKKGYIKGNLQFTDKMVNRMKLNCPEAFFYSMCAAVTEYRKKDFTHERTVWTVDDWNDTERPHQERFIGEVSPDGTVSPVKRLTSYRSTREA